MNPNITAFAARIVSDASLQKRLRDIEQQPADTVAEGVAKFASEVGTPFTAQDYDAAMQRAGDELSDEQLESVAGGLWRPSFVNILASIGFAPVCGIIALSSLQSQGNADKCQPDGENG